MGKFERPNGVAFPPSLMRTLKRRPGTLGQRWDASGSREHCLPCLHCVTMDPPILPTRDALGLS